MVSLYAARAATHSIWQKTHDFLALKRLHVYIFREGPEGDGLQLPGDEPVVRRGPEAPGGETAEPRSSESGGPYGR
jgi:hypothetical protein